MKIANNKMSKKNSEKEDITLSLKENEAVFIYKILCNLSELKSNVNPLKDKIKESIKDIYEEPSRLDLLRSNRLNVKYLQKEGFYLKVDYEVGHPDICGTIENIPNIDIMRTWICCENIEEVEKEFKTKIAALKELGFYPLRLDKIFDAMNQLPKYDHETT